MNLEELRKSMESEATVENKKLKEEVERLKKQLKKEERDRSHEKASLIGDCRALTNRCYALTHGSMCMFCQLNLYMCDHAMPLDEKIAAAKKMMEECGE